MDDVGMLEEFIELFAVSLVNIVEIDGNVVAELGVDLQNVVR